MIRVCPQGEARNVPLLKTRVIIGDDAPTACRTLSLRQLSMCENGPALTSFAGDRMAEDLITDSVA